ncbi:Zn-dependent peptidase ImmA (M78 family) [Glaciihabitans sp. GrIS 2.15]|nr:Zn-dependent peptidase ImmA (M78 family) [Glaciihabitans sp. GrIS 2.15]
MNVRTPVADAYTTHEKYWADTGGDLTVPVDPYRIAESMGVRVYTATLGPQRSGYLDIEAMGGPVIYVNEAHSPSRNRFTCAHELGHFVDATNRSLPPRAFDRDERASRGTDSDEIYANRFAAALLMPKIAIQRLVADGLNAEELARRFNVSLSAMELRLRNLGLPQT